MKAASEYKNIQEFLQDLLVHRYNKNQGYSLRAFASQLEEIQYKQVALENHLLEQLLTRLGFQLLKHVRRLKDWSG